MLINQWDKIHIFSVLITPLLKHSVLLVKSAIGETGQLGDHWSKYQAITWTSDDLILVQMYFIKFHGNHGQLLCICANI